MEVLGLQGGRASFMGCNCPLRILIIPDSRWLNSGVCGIALRPAEFVQQQTCSAAFTSSHRWCELVALATTDVHLRLRTHEAVTIFYQRVEVHFVGARGGLGYSPSHRVASVQSVLASSARAA